MDIYISVEPKKKQLNQKGPAEVWVWWGFDAKPMVILKLSLSFSAYVSWTKVLWDYFSPKVSALCFIFQEGYLEKKFSGI